MIRQVERKSQRVLVLCVVLATVGALVTLGAFVSGFVTGVKKEHAAQQVNAEIAEIRTSLVEGQDSPEELSDKLRESASRMEESDDPEAVAIGKYLKFVADTSEAPSARLTAAMETVASEWFLDLRDMLETGDFERHRKVAREYEAAAKALLTAQKKIRDVTHGGLARFGMKGDMARGVQVGFDRTFPFSLRLIESHIQVSVCYTAAIDYVEKNRAEIELDANGDAVFGDGVLESGYDEVYERMSKAEAELNAAVDAYTAAISQGQ